MRIKKWKPLAVFAALIGSTALFYSALIFISSIAERPGSRILIQIAPGSSLAQVAEELESNRLISSRALFISYARLSGAGRSLQAGEYQFERGDSIATILDALVSGRVSLRRALIAPGATIYDIGKIMGEYGADSSEEFLQEARAIKWREKYGIDGESVEGYLAPDTYLISKSDSSVKLIGAALENFFTKTIKSIPREIASDRKKLKELVTLASIVEKEVAVDSELELVASVYHNRLKKGMALQADPTAIYPLLPNFDGNLRKKDLRAKNLYNTYQIKGLPLGPICNPSRASIEAVLNPAKSDYLYFVAKEPGGEHHFSRSLKEHRNAVKKYQRRGR